jgi:hypothetical protein
MSVAAASILSHLEAVAQERAVRQMQPNLESSVKAVKSFQQRRFSKTYADLLTSPRYGAASRFFLSELYGPVDFTERDAQFAKVVPALVRLFPNEIVETVSILAELHALSETLDSAMGRELTSATLCSREYVLAWQRVGRSEARATQVRLTVEVAGRLDRLTRNPLLRNGLRLMRGPAASAGLGELQRFLESGFDTFGAMKGAKDFIAMVQTRETELASALFCANPGDNNSGSMELASNLLPNAEAQ